jgi:hypothetical protein
VLLVNPLALHLNPSVGAVEDWNLNDICIGRPLHASTVT